MPLRVIFVPSDAVAMPRSASFVTPSSRISTFAGFTSRWTIPCGVRVVERVAQVEHHPAHLLGAQRPSPQHPRQRLAVHVLHDDQHALVVGRGVEDGHEVRVVQGCPELRFAVEALLDVHRAVGMQALYGHLAAQPLVLA